jgi:hypothetical protein
VCVRVRSCARTHTHSPARTNARTHTHTHTHTHTRLRAPTSASALARLPAAPVPAPRRTRRQDDHALAAAARQRMWTCPPARRSRKGSGTRAGLESREAGCTSGWNSTDPSARRPRSVRPPRAAAAAPQPSATQAPMELKNKQPHQSKSHLCQLRLPQHGTKDATPLDGICRPRGAAFFFAGGGVIRPSLCLVTGIRAAGGARATGAAAGRACCCCEGARGRDTAALPLSCAAERSAAQKQRVGGAL